MEEYYNSHKDNENIRELLLKMYNEENLDPDGKAVRYVHGIKCTADGLHSMKRICSFEETPENIIAVYKIYREVPIFFFPCEMGGINTSRYRVFGDRIDHTLFDIKMYYTEKERCRLKSAYEKRKTAEWMEAMGSFEAVVDWLGVRGIFTDDSYRIYDLNSTDDETVQSYWKAKDYREQWSKLYYTNLKIRIGMFLKRNGSNVFENE